jgi:hypothetical protein
MDQVRLAPAASTMTACASNDSHRPCSMRRFRADRELTAVEIDHIEVHIRLLGKRFLIQNGRVRPIFFV